jgi:hypothetical protein
MIKTKLWAQNRALASNNIDKSCVASTSSLGGPETDGGVSSMFTPDPWLT